MPPLLSPIYISQNSAKRLGCLASSGGPDYVIFTIVLVTLAGFLHVSSVPDQIRYVNQIPVSLSALSNLLLTLVFSFTSSLLPFGVSAPPTLWWRHRVGGGVTLTVVVA